MHVTQPASRRRRRSALLATASLLISGGAVVTIAALAPVVASAAPENPDIATINVTFNDPDPSHTLSWVEGDADHSNTALVNVSIEDPAGNNLGSAAAEFRGRGNYTWKLSKKPYQIKFDKKQSVLGMDKAKTWVLLANAADGSLMRNKVAYDLARAIGMPGAPDSRFVDLRINGQYRGTYMVSDKVQVNETRLNLTDPQGVLVEMDNNYGAAEDYHFSSNTSNNMFVLNDAVSEVPDKSEGPLPADTQAGWDAFRSKMNQLDSLLAASSPNWSAISNLIDVDSFVRYYFVYELTENPEVVASSIYFYMNGPNDKIHAGPVWDFDSGLFNYETLDPKYASVGDLGVDPNNDYVKNAQFLRTRNPAGPWYYHLFRNTQFVQAANQAWHDGIGYAINQLPSKIDSYKAQLNNSAADNFQRWTNVLGHSSLLNQPWGHNYASTYSGEVSYLKGKVSQRVQLLNKEYGTNAPLVRAQPNVTSIGWNPWVNTGQIIGTVRRGLPLNGINLTLSNLPVSGGIEANAHLSHVGWVGYKSSSSTWGNPGAGTPFEAIQIRLTGTLASQYDVSYRAQVSSIGWQPWVTNGATAGTTGQSKTIEAVQIRLLAKNPSTPKPGPINQPTTTPTTTTSTKTTTTTTTTTTTPTTTTTTTTAPASTFTDVPPGAPFFDDIEWLSGQGITTGYNNEDGTTSFHPAESISREAMSAFLYRFAGSPAFTPPATSPFTDVPTDAAFYKEISWVDARGIDTGATEGENRTFSPSEKVTRETMAVMLYRFAGSPAFDPPATSPFTDVQSTDPAYKEITWLAQTGITTGYDQPDHTVTYQPADPVSRQAMAAFYHRYANEGLPKPA